MSVTIYHNSRCSKSRQTLALLEEKGIEPEIVEYLKTSPDAETVKNLLSMLELSPRELMRKGEAVYKENNLADDGLSDDQLINAMVEKSNPDRAANCRLQWQSCHRSTTRIRTRHHLKKPQI